MILGRAWATCHQNTHFCQKLRGMTLIGRPLRISCRHLLMSLVHELIENSLPSRPCPPKLYDLFSKTRMWWASSLRCLIVHTQSSHEMKWGRLKSKQNTSPPRTRIPRTKFWFLRTLSYLNPWPAPCTTAKTATQYRRCGHAPLDSIFTLAITFM